MADIPGGTSTSATVTVGSTTSGTLEVVGDHDWYKITLTAGQTITITLNGVTLEDPYLTIRDSAGNVIFENDDINPGVIRDSKLSFTAPASGTYYIDVGAFDADAGGPGDYAGTYQLAVSNYVPPPVASLDTIADQLVNGFWGDPSQSHHFDVAQGGTITVNLTGLTVPGQTLARAALSMWSDVIGVKFEEVATGGQIVFDDDQEGAFTEANWTGHITDSAHVNISTDWLDTYGTSLNSYSFQTYIHEIGHALGLGHAGNYNGDANFISDALFLNDAWSTSVMSYFSPTDGSYFAPKGFTDNFVGSPMGADIVAMQELYGLSTTTRTGNTTYGFNSNADRQIYHSDLYPGAAYTVFDSGGVDTFDFSGFANNQLINLNAETFSNIGPGIGNVSIARGSVIENAKGGSGWDTLIGNSSNNVLDGGGGDYNTISYETAASGVTIDTRISGPQDTRGAGTDTLLNYNILIGSAFNDTLIGTDGAPGHQVTLHGGSGNDRLIASPDGEQLWGDDGDDTFIGSPSHDDMIGGAGFDTVDFSSSTAGVSTRDFPNIGADGADHYESIERFIGSAFDDELTGASVMIGGDGNDTIGEFWGSGQFVGGRGNDTYEVYSADNVVIEKAGEGIDLVRSQVTFRLGANVENLQLLGSTSLNGTGNDLANVITGNSGANLLNGAGGNDTLRGGAGDDTLNGGIGADRLVGGLGDDRYYVDNAHDQVTENSGAGTDRVYSSISLGLESNVEQLFLTGATAINGNGNSLNNVLVGNSAANDLKGGLGADRMVGGAGDDRYYVDNAHDQVTENSGEGTDRVYSSIDFALDSNIEQLFLTGSADINGSGNSLNNVLLGNAGSNILSGGLGNDRLIGGAGDDDLRGGDGADTFIFRDGDFAGLTASTADRIVDFSHGQGDRIDLDAVDSNSLAGGDQDFAFIGTAGFHHVAGELRYELVDGNTYVYGDTNGDGLADMMIRLDGSHALTSGDFVF